MQITDINRHWERVINTMNEALLIISKEGCILSVNHSFEEMTGYAGDEVLGRPCTRGEDIPLLVNTFINRLELRTGKSIRGLTRQALNRFMDYPWPGNVREMKSALEYAFTVADKDTIDIDHLPPHMLLEDNPPIISMGQPAIGKSANAEDSSRH